MKITRLRTCRRQAIFTVVISLTVLSHNSLSEESPPSVSAGNVTTNGTTQSVNTDKITDDSSTNNVLDSIAKNSETKNSNPGEVQAELASNLIRAGIPGVEVKTEKAANLNKYQQLKWAVEAILAPNRAASKKVWHVYSPDDIPTGEYSNTLTQLITGKDLPQTSGIFLISRDDLSDLVRGSSKELSLQTVVITDPDLNSWQSARHLQAIDEAFTKTVGDASKQGYLIGSSFEIAGKQAEARIVSEKGNR